MVALQADIVTPDPTDAAWPKWVGHAVLGTTSAIILYSAGKKVLNPNLEGTSTSTEVPWMPNDGFDNTEHYYRPGSTPPKWFWPSVGAAAAYELYENWPSPEPLKVDKTNVVQPIVKPLPRRN
jgi:hypothetical protein